jgi:two-component system sensor histidine kinase UhpB
MASRATNGHGAVMGTGHILSSGARSPRALLPAVVRRAAGALRRWLRPRPSLAWRVFVVNAALFVAFFLFLLGTPATVSTPVVVSEVAVLLVALVIALVLNLVLVRRALAPLERLAQAMGSIDVLEPGQRVELDGPETDVQALSRAFNEMLERLETERRDSARRVLRAQEQERLRVGRELHDELGQVLTGLVLQLDTAVRFAPAELRPRLEEIREATRGGLEEVRGLSRRLRPDALDDLGLRSALAALTTRIGRQGDIAVRRRLARELPPLGVDEELTIYRVAQEALTNAVRHAQPTEVELTLQWDGEHVVMSVRDDGRGYDRRPPNGGGIRGMRERALAVGGTLTVSSAPGAGTEVRLVIAAPGPERAEDEEAQPSP